MSARAWRLIAIASATGLAASAAAQDTTGGVVGLAISPLTPLPLRDAPPGGFFQPKGAFLGTAEPGEAYRVIEERSVPTIFGTEQWVKIVPSNPDSGELPVAWIYTGPSSSPLSNITIGQK